jgi:hypothetical protein
VDHEGFAWVVNDKNVIVKLSPDGGTVMPGCATEIGVF